MGARLGLFGILLVSCGLRLSALGVNLPHTYWHDENNFVETALRFGQGTLEPYGLRHGMLLPLGLLVEYAGLYAALLAGGVVHSARDFIFRYLADPTWWFLLGRLTVAVLGLWVIWLTMRLGRRVADPAVGAVAAWYVGVSFLMVNLSTFIKEDMLATALLLVTVLRAHAFSGASSGLSDVGRTRHQRSPAIAVERWRAIEVGWWLGLATAAKYTAILGWVVVGLAHWYRMDGTPPAPRLRRLVMSREAWASLVGWAAGFVAGTPFVLVNPRLFLDGVLLVGGAYAMPPALWLQGLSTIWTHLCHAVGVPLLLLTVLGAVGLLRVRSGRAWLALALPVVWVGFMSRFAGYAFHLTPAVPFLAVAAAWATVRLVRWGVHDARRHGVALALVACAVAWPTAADSMRYVRLLRRPDTRTLAKAWLEAHVAPETPLLIEGDIDGELVSGPPIARTSADWRREMQRRKAAGGTGRLVGLRLALEERHPSPGPRYQVEAVQFLTDERLRETTAPYVVVCGFYDAEREADYAPSRLERPATYQKPGFRAEREAMRQALRERFDLVVAFEPGVRLTEFVPTLLMEDYRRLRRQPLLGSWEGIRQGPVIEIYRVRPRAGASDRS